jgi:NAD(P)-dependent dehydrogenase (short-subunit alcohol dehydrogenase family)
MNISGCAAIVTGGASGLGEATARMLAAAGARVAVLDVDTKRGEQLANAIGGIYARVDVTDTNNVEDGLNRAAEVHGEARILVNCAGIIIARKITSRGEPHALDEFERVIRINLAGTFNCIRLVSTRMAALPRMNDEERGVIVNTASISAFEGQIGQAAYAASKGGIVSMTLPLARDLAHSGIRVVSIAPGIFKTPMIAGLPRKVQDALGASVPFPSRLGEPSEYAAMVQHICENPMLNGETIRLDGAIRMAPG